jgi:hypothetical protein
MTTFKASVVFQELKALQTYMLVPSTPVESSPGCARSHAGAASQ